MLRPTRFLALAAVTLTGAVPLFAQDAERATHTDDASKPQVTFTVEEPTHRLWQHQLGCLSLLSYTVVSGGEAIVVDPQRDVDHYLELVTAAGAKLRYVALTHPHADFVAGHTELAARTGAEVLISRHAGAEFAHRALDDGDAVQMGQVTLRMWHTPGHTPNASTFLLSVGGEQEPRYAFTGDTLFIGGIGRPDLLDVPPAQLAAQSFDSIQRLKSLPDATLVLPAHGAGSLCGAHLSPATTSTIGDEKRTNEYLRIAGRSSFIAKVLSHQPVAPQYFGFNVELNRKGPPAVDRGQSMPPKLDLAAVKAAPDAWLVDLRHQHAYAEAHLRGAVNVALRGRLDTWTGIVVPPDAELWVVGAEKEVAEGVFRLRRIGYDRIAGWIEDDVSAWRAAGLDVRSSKLVAPKDLYALMQKGAEPIVIDVRTADEHADLRLGDIGNIPVTESQRFGKTLPKEMPVVMLCNSAYRSSMAVGLAERQGFVDVASLDGGMDAWLAEGLPAIGRMVDAAAVRLPAAVSAKELAADTNGAALFDLRAEWEWNDWRVPGSQRVGLDELVGVVAELPSDRRIVLLSKDGESAFAAAGALLKQYPDRAITVLRGGVVAYYREVVLRSASAAPTASSPLPAAAPSATKPVVKKRNVGC